MLYYGRKQEITMFEKLKNKEQIVGILEKLEKLEERIDYLEKLVKGLKNKGISQ